MAAEPKPIRKLTLDISNEQYCQMRDHCTALTRATGVVATHRSVLLEGLARVLADPRPAAPRRGGSGA